MDHWFGLFTTGTVGAKGIGWGAYGGDGAEAGGTVDGADLEFPVLFGHILVVRIKH